MNTTDTPSGGRVVLAAAALAGALAAAPSAGWATNIDASSWLRELDEASSRDPASVATLEWNRENIGAAAQIATGAVLLLGGILLVRGAAGVAVAVGGVIIAGGGLKRYGIDIGVGELQELMSRFRSN